MIGLNIMRNAGSGGGGFGNYTNRPNGIAQSPSGWGQALGAIGGALGGIGTMGLGSLIGAGGMMLGRQLFGDMFDDTSKNTSQLQNAAQSAINLSNQSAAGRTKAGMYSAAGTVGPDVRQQYRDREMSLGLSAGASKSMADLNAAKKSILGAAGQQGRLAQLLAERQGGATRRQGMNLAARAGGSPASIAGVGSQIAEQQQQGLLANLANSGQQYQQALEQSANLTGQAYGIQDQDLQRRWQQYVKPHEAQINPSVDISETLAGQISQGVQTDKSVVNPLEGFASGLGQIGTFANAGAAPWFMGLT